MTVVGGRLKTYSSSESWHIPGSFAAYPPCEEELNHSHDSAALATQKMPYTSPKQTTTVGQEFNRKTTIVTGKGDGRRDSCVSDLNHGWQVMKEARSGVADCEMAFPLGKSLESSSQSKFIILYPMSLWWKETKQKSLPVAQYRIKPSRTDCPVYHRKSERL